MSQVKRTDTSNKKKSEKKQPTTQLSTELSAKRQREIQAAQQKQRAEEVARTLGMSTDQASVTTCKTAVVSLCKDVKEGYGLFKKAGEKYIHSIKTLADQFPELSKDREKFQAAILKATRLGLGIANEKEQTDEARAYRAFATFCRQSFDFEKMQLMSVTKAQLQIEQQKNSEENPATAQQPATQQQKRQKLPGLDATAEELSNFVQAFQSAIIPYIEVKAFVAARLEEVKAEIESTTTNEEA